MVLATGAPADRPLGIPGDDLPGVIGSAAFVGWYNGHPDFADLNPPLRGPGAVVVGAGNVALDVARILAKTGEEFTGSDIVNHALDGLGEHRIERVTILARRGPHEIAMTPKELGELGHLARAAPLVDPADLPPVEADAALEPGVRKSVAHLRSFAAVQRPPSRSPSNSISSPCRSRSRAMAKTGRVERVIVERTRIDELGRARRAPARPMRCRRIWWSAASAIAPRRSPDVPYDEKLGRFANDEGRIGGGLYAVGWARRGPTGTIGTNRPDGFAIAELIAADTGADSAKPGRPALDALLSEREVDLVTFRDWQKIEAAEVAARPRRRTAREVHQSGRHAGGARLTHAQPRFGLDRAPGCG